MKPRAWVLSVVLLLGAAAGWGAYQMSQPATPDLAAVLPEGALLYMESPDFGALLHDWQASSEHAAWIKSDNFAVFSRSRLFERLKSAQDEFAAAAGLPPDMDLLSEVAGKRSALAWYDIGKLEFVYASRTPGFTASRLWNARNTFQTRSVGANTFYVRTDPQSGRTVAFASTPELVLLATREDLLASALSRVSGDKGRTIRDERWYADAVAAAGKPGDLRMILNLEKIVPSPYFRSYWIQQNITEMKAYRAAISDLYRSSQEYREERVLLKKAVGGSEAVQGPDVSDLTALLPQDAGVYRLQAAPAAADAVATLSSRFLAPHAGAVLSGSYAPVVNTPAQGPGAASDLETRIDLEQVEAAKQDPARALRLELAGIQLKGMLEYESSHRADHDVFVGFHRTVVLESESDWNQQQVLAALQEGLASQLTTAKLGVTWQPGGSGYFRLDGLVPMAVAIRGPLLIVSDSEAEVSRVIANAGGHGEKDAQLVYAAGFRHGAERDNFRRISGMLDHTGPDSGASEAGHVPAFFSGNVRSLSDMFAGVDAETVRVRTSGENVTQTITYRWRP